MNVVYSYNKSSNKDIKNYSAGKIKSCNKKGIIDYSYINL